MHRSFDIRLKTKFRWRYKILKCTSECTIKVTPNVIIKSDEIFFAISFKGTNEENFNILRVAHRHSVSTRGLL